MLLKIVEDINIVGIEIKTNNKEAFKTIPLHWNKFFSEQISQKIQNTISNDIYGIYTNFENKGINADGQYSFIIGMKVLNFDNISNNQNNLVKIIIPKSNYQVFGNINKPEQIGEKWQEIWQHNFENQRTFLLEFEKYYDNGKIDIFIGIK